MAVDGKAARLFGTYAEDKDEIHRSLQGTERTIDVHSIFCHGRSATWWNKITSIVYYMSHSAFTGALVL